MAGNNNRVRSKLGGTASTSQPEQPESTTLHRFSPFAAIAAAIILLIPFHAVAGSFRAMPLRLYIDGESKTEVLRLVNEGKEKVTVQLDPKRWTHDDDGQDIYGDAPKIVIFPKMATIEPGETQVIRIGYIGSSATEEQTYRLFVQELPVNKPGEMALKFALTLSLPVFVAPENEVIQWSVASVNLAQESLQLKVNNNGNRHIMINKIQAPGLDAGGTEVFTQEATGWYTLGGKSRTYAVEIPYQACLKASRINVEVQTKTASKQLDLAVEKSMCTRKPEPENKTAKHNSYKLHQ